MMKNLQSNPKTADNEDLYPEPLNEIDANDGGGVRNKILILSCTDGRKSILAYSYVIEDLGFSNVYVLDGGVKAWAEANLPLTIVASGEISSDSEDSD
jgi:rhodanese-related sulfurtransferase